MIEQPDTHTGPASQPSTERCRCGHAKGDHSGRRDHQKKGYTARPWCHACEAACLHDPTAAPSAPADDLPARLRTALTERFTELGNPFSEMRRHEKGPDGWPASHPVGPHQVAEVLRELLAAVQPAPAETDEERTDREETERDHAKGDHTHCGLTCETEVPTEHLRNFVIAKGYPGTKGALDELLRRARAERPLSPYYEHPACGFHWHGRDGMDIPTRDGQPVCPRCELRRLTDEAQPAESPADRCAECGHWRGAHEGGRCLNCADEHATHDFEPTAEAQQTSGIRGLLEHVGIDTTGRDISVAGKVVDRAQYPADMIKTQQGGQP